MLEGKILYKIIEFLTKKKAESLTEPPSKLRSGLANHLGPDEEVLFTLRDFRAIYKAPRWIDHNTFFNSWVILTSERIIIARNSSSFKKFRDIPLDEIKKVDYETGALESRLTIDSQGKVDIIEFLREAREYSESLNKIINQALENARNRGQYAQSADATFCPKCGSRIPKESRFCPQCGERIKVEQILP